MRLLPSFIGLVACALLVGACGTTAPVALEDASTEAPRPEAAEHRAQILRAAAEAWNGTPHQWGGTSPEGVDCSGLVHALYRDSLDKELPRTTKEQSQIGASVAPADLRPGDLVFFRVNTRTGRHVGIYLSDGDFLHASSQTGVTVSSLQSTYWRDRWWQARRIFASPPSSTAEEAVATPPAVGW
ncbi:MAG: C40 family peptidase [Salinivenus sp.]